MKRINHQRIIFSLFALLTICLEIAAAPGFINPQAGGWSTPASISAPQVTSWFPDIVSDSLNHVHVAWAAGTSGFDTVLYTSSADGVNWSKINDIAAVPQNGTDSAATRPALWVDANGYLNLSYVSSTLYFTRAPVATAGSAAAWVQPEKLNGNQIAYFSRIIQDPHNQLHLFYTENVVSNNCTQCYHLFHRVSTDNAVTWSDPQDISADGTGAAKPQIVANDKGGIFAVWESGIGGGLGQLSSTSVVKFAASTDFGKTWTQSTTLSPASIDEAKDITIGLDGKGNLVTAWLALPDNTVDFQKSSDDGKTWSKPTPINGITGSWDTYPSKLDDYSMVTDSSGAIHLVLIGQLQGSETPTPAPKDPSLTPTPGNLDVLHLTWQNNSWSDPDIVTKFNGDVPEWPRAAISGGNVLNLVWFVRDQANIWNSDNAHYRIWYTRKQLNAPALPTVMPTFSTTPTAMDNISLTPAITQVVSAIDPLPTLAPAEKIQTQTTYSESDYVTIFAKSIAPTAVVIFVIGLIVFAFKRYR